MGFCFPTVPGPASLPPSGPAGGDLNGTFPNPTVDGLQGRPVSSAAPSTGSALVWNGSAWAPGTPSGTLSETAGEAIAIGKTVYRGASPGRMFLETGTEQSVRYAFHGFTKTAAAANGDPITIAANGTKATGLSGLTVGQGYYVSNGTLYAQGAALDAFVNGAPSGTWYRFVGTADTTTSLDQAWGEPQQVP